MPETHTIVFHRPGPQWNTGLPPFEQDGVQRHVAHYRQWLEQGKLLLGGPFLDRNGGGMMVIAPGVDAAEAAAFAAADPAVVSGLLLFELRPWLVGMRSAP